MRTSISKKRSMRRLAAASGALGLLLVGVATATAHAESVRARQWHLDAMQAEEMWQTSKGRGITIAVIDSGVDSSLPDLKGRVLDGKDYSDQRGDEHTDLAGHGTNVASLIAATGGRGAVNGSYGLAPGARILPIRMRYSEEDFGKFDAGAQFSRNMAEAIRYAAGTEAQIINISMGAYDAPGRKNVSTAALTAAVKYALDKGKLIFAAAGNDGAAANRLGYPAATPGVVGIGATDKNAKALALSQSGPQIDLVAPGIDMIHACLGKTGVCRTSGTSDATAIASAAAALVWSAHLDWTRNQVLRVILNTAGKPTGGEKRTDFVGYGTVRPRVALKNPGDPGPADEYPLPDLAAAASQSPSPEASRREGSAGDTHPGSDTPTPAASKPGEDRRKGLWTGLGIAAAVLLAVAVTILIVRKRRNATTTPPPPTYPPLSGNGTAHPPHQENPNRPDPYNIPPGPGPRN
ncbi:type VII secretion-associated serine protease mycosin [Streptomyces sp. NPDC005925]|uniref:type VII secretion-associated serine protease mycosin n=1 Tax=Streptomyces sp. NPDC005925 TaxID=3157172 RepID=UPI00340D9345